MAFGTPAKLGTAASTSGTTVVSGLSIGVGVLVVVLFGGKDTGASSPSIADSSGGTNVWTSYALRGSTTEWQCISFCNTAAAITSITVTQSGTITGGAMAVLSIACDGTPNEDTNILVQKAATTSGNTVTTGAPAGANRMMIAMANFFGTSVTYTEDTSHGWTNLYKAQGNSIEAVSVAYQSDATNATKIYAPTLSTLGENIYGVIGFFETDTTPTNMGLSGFSFVASATDAKTETTPTTMALAGFSFVASATDAKTETTPTTMALAGFSFSSVATPTTPAAATMALAGFSFSSVATPTTPSSATMALAGFSFAAVATPTTPSSATMALAGFSFSSVATPTTPAAATMALAEFSFLAAVIAQHTAAANMALAGFAFQGVATDFPPSPPPPPPPSGIHHVGVVLMGKMHVRTV